MSKRGDTLSQARATRPEDQAPTLSGMTEVPPTNKGEAATGPDCNSTTSRSSFGPSGVPVYGQGRKRTSGRAANRHRLLTDWTLANGLLIKAEKLRSKIGRTSEPIFWIRTAPIESAEGSVRALSMSC